MAWSFIVIVVLVGAAVLVPARWFGGDAGSVSDRIAAVAGGDGGGGDGERPTRQTVEQLRDELRAAATTGYDYPIDAEQVSSVVTRPGPLKVLGRISIPSVGLDTEYAAGVHPSALEKGPGHWPGTPAPGQPGNAVLSGHRNTHTQPFKELDVLEVGDPIVIERLGSGRPVTFRVFDTIILPEAEYADFVLRRPEDPEIRQITLFACHPEGNPINRIIVQARVDGDA